VSFTPSDGIARQEAPAKSACPHPRVRSRGHQPLPAAEFPEAASLL